jgi:hypothetical protein
MADASAELSAFFTAMFETRAIMCGVLFRQPPMSRLRLWRVDRSMRRRNREADLQHIGREYEIEVSACARWAPLSNAILDAQRLLYEIRRDTSDDRDLEPVEHDLRPAAVRLANFLAVYDRCVEHS